MNNPVTPPKTKRTNSNKASKSDLNSKEALDERTGMMVNPERESGMPEKEVVLQGRDRDRKQENRIYARSYCCGFINTGESFFKNCCRITICCVCVPAAIALVIIQKDKINLDGLQDKLKCGDKIDCACLEQCCDTDKCRDICECGKCLECGCWSNICSFVSKDCCGNIGNCFKCDTFCCNPNIGCYNFCKCFQCLPCDSFKQCGKLDNISCCVDGFLGCCKKPESRAMVGPGVQTLAFCCCIMHDSQTNRASDKHDRKHFGNRVGPAGQQN